MKLVKSGEAPGAVTFLSALSKNDIYEIFQILIAGSRKVSPLYIFKDPLYLFRVVNYAGALIREDHLYLRRSATTPSILIYFDLAPDGRTIVTFKASYLPVFRWLFYLSIPGVFYFMYQAIALDSSTNAIIATLGVCSLIWIFIGLIAYLSEKSIRYFFTRDVNLIVNDLNTRSKT